MSDTPQIDTDKITDAARNIGAALGQVGDVSKDIVDNISRAVEQVPAQIDRALAPFTPPKLNRSQRRAKGKKHARLGRDEAWKRTRR